MSGYRQKAIKEIGMNCWLRISCNLIFFVLFTAITFTSCSGGASLRDSDAGNPSSSDKPDYCIKLADSDVYHLPVLEAGYTVDNANNASLAVDISNIGSKPTGVLSIALSGDNSGSFTFSRNSIDSILPDGSDSFTIQPIMDLAAGTYRATVTISGDNDISAVFNVTLTVTDVPKWGISLNPSNDYIFTAVSKDYTPQTHDITVINQGNQPTGTLSIVLSGTNSNSFTLTKSSISNIAAGGSDSFTVQPIPYLPEGIYTATVTVSGNEGISASFNVKFDAKISSAYRRAGRIAIFGKIPPDESSKLYQIQVGAFKKHKNAEKMFKILSDASLNPIYVKYRSYTRVLIAGIPAKDVAARLEQIRALGFLEAWIKEDVTALPVSTAALPIISSTEIGFCTIKVGEIKNITDFTKNRNIVKWSSSTPSSFSVNSEGEVKGINVGNGFVSINENEYISIAVVPTENFYVVKDSEVTLLPANSKTGDASTTDITEYRTEPTFRLAYRFNNKGEEKGASGGNGGIDIIARGENYGWLWTTYRQGGWFYDLNGIKREMVNGYQKDYAAGVELIVKPEFIYEDGVPYLQLRHILRNTNDFAVSNQQFGASADVMIHQNDHAALLYKPYGAYMTDSESNPSIELVFIGLSGQGITPVNTLWLGIWDNGSHLYYIYDDWREDVIGEDTAIGFSYKNIHLKPKEFKEFIVRFTLVRKENM